MGVRAAGKALHARSALSTKCRCVCDHQNRIAVSPPLLTRCGGARLVYKMSFVVVCVLPLSSLRGQLVRIWTAGFGRDLGRVSGHLHACPIARDDLFRCHLVFAPTNRSVAPWFFLLLRLLLGHSNRGCDSVLISSVECRPATAVSCTCGGMSVCDTRRVASCSVAPHLRFMAYLTLTDACRSRHWG